MRILTLVFFLFLGGVAGLLGITGPVHDGSGDIETASLDDHESSLVRNRTTRPRRPSTQKPFPRLPRTGAFEPSRSAAAAAELLSGRIPYPPDPRGLQEVRRI